MSDQKRAHGRLTRERLQQWWDEHGDCLITEEAFEALVALLSAPMPAEEIKGRLTEERFLQWWDEHENSQARDAFKDLNALLSAPTRKCNCTDVRYSRCPVHEPAPTSVEETK